MAREQYKSKHERRHEKIRVCCCFLYLITEIRVKKSLILRQGTFERSLECGSCLHFFRVADVADKVPTFLDDFVADFVVRF